MFTPDKVRDEPAESSFAIYKDRLNYLRRIERKDAVAPPQKTEKDEKPPRQPTDQE
ncbi:MAG: hypothetical protein HZC40_23620 [Chloroflexi bacterium]|nr:hypothetical protein [Chloroflexota bacterium]